MTKKNKATSQEELEDAIKRMKKHPEAKRGAKNDETWGEFLSEVLGISPSSVKADNFWEDVRQGVKGKRELPLPSEHDLTLAQVKSSYRNEKTNQISYRGSDGRFIKVIRYGKNNQPIS